MEGRFANRICHIVLCTQASTHYKPNSISKLFDHNTRFCHVCEGNAYPGRKDTIKACIYVKELVRFMLYRLEHHEHGVELYNCCFKPAKSMT